MIIETPRLVLREFVEGDWPVVLAYQSDPRYLRLYAWTERTPADVRAFVAGFVASQAAEPRLTYQLAITLRDGEKLVGNCGIRLAEPGARVGDLHEQVTELRERGIPMNGPALLRAVVFLQTREERGPLRRDTALVLQPVLVPGFDERGIGTRQVRGFVKRFKAAIHRGFRSASRRREKERHYTSARGGKVP